MIFLARTPQIEGDRKLERGPERWNIDRAAGRDSLLEAAAAARFRLVGVDRKGLIIASAGVRHVVDAAAQGARVPGVDDVESQRRMHTDGRLQGRRQIPGFEAHAGDEFAGPAGRCEWHAPAVAGYDVMALVQAIDLDLQPLDGR